MSAFSALHGFSNKYGRLPKPHGEEDANELVQIAKNVQAGSTDLGEFDLNVEAYQGACIPSSG